MDTHTSQVVRDVALFVKSMREAAQVFQGVNIQNPYAGVHIERDSEGNSTQTRVIEDSIPSWHANSFLTAVCCCCPIALGPNFVGPNSPFGLYVTSGYFWCGCTVVPAVTSRVITMPIGPRIPCLLFVWVLCWAGGDRIEL